ncbi:RAMP superfamily CRISPR-associated protein [Candidatus Solincola sp.]|jgi:CRISPR-associated protein Cmr2|nr:RAMP superfamily CRISPR-associated protein [Thermoanaerobacteraceae bacterium]MDI6874590.1 RAMP superfamily CRISPR-associated protein [Actinomycetota bacterium]
MTWDYYAWLTCRGHGEETPTAWALSSGFVDHLSKCFLEAEIERLEAEEANNRERRRQAEDKKTILRKMYMQKASCRFPIKLYPQFHQIDFAPLSSWAWLGLQVDFELLTPWYSKDDRVFHVMDNPVRKDRVFGVPFMAGSSWKGMLRWACRVQAGLREHLEQHNGKLDDWRDPDWILHLFGNEKDEEENFHQGALVFYPTWFDKIGFEVINPHSRERRAGTQPVYYEVVPPGAKGTLYLLYAPWPGMKPGADPKDVPPRLLEAIEALLTTYGISAKRTVGWGTAKILKWRVYRKGKEPQEATREEWEREASEKGRGFWRFFWERKVLPLLKEGCAP